MEAGAHVWVTDKDGDDAWLLAEVISRSSSELKMILMVTRAAIVRPRVTPPSSNGPSIVEEFKYQGVELANTKLSEADKEDGKDDDMITLPHLHEPAILHAISERYDIGKIYTWTGPVLIAVNPFQRLPLYATETLESYRREGLLRSQGMNSGKKHTLGPHLFAIADLSYRQMMSEKRKSQSILISGESGAGKTESTKYVMKYLTTLGTSHLPSDSTGSNQPPTADMYIMERILQSNPILEAFGNARTLRNDNSSRFGKFIELGFSRSGSLLGAKIQTYLLEKVRLGFHASGERNYHIFYQLLRGSTDEQKKRYGFHVGNTNGLELVNFYHFTGQGGAPQLREYSDEDGFKHTLSAMSSLGWNESKMNTVISLVAGLLHLGQITFVGVSQAGSEEIAVVENETTLISAAKYLGVDKDKLNAALVERVLVTKSETLNIKLTPSKAIDSRDALAKTIYGSLFLWVVSEVNKSVAWASQADVRSSIGVLDIFGFECFAVNSFEQLCINFTNESLQQQFNKFIFKMEQTEYEREHINWTFIEFPDNQDCLDTIQGKPSGILTMLDDECRLGARGNDKNWADRLYTVYIPDKDRFESANTRFSATPIQKSKSIFCIRHFAGVVEYSAKTGFLEKNKDEIPVGAQNLFETSDSWLIKEIYSIQKAEAEDVGGGSGKASRSKTVAQQFKDQLNTLMERIESTEPHYIRCLKPNDAAKPKLLTRKRLTEQLRYGGVLEAVRVARLGFPVRLDHSLFFRTYRILLPSVPEELLAWQLEGDEARDLCVRLLDMLLEEGARMYSHGKSERLNRDTLSRAEKIRSMQVQPIPMIFPKTDVQLGKSKVFMRKPAHDALEAHRVFHQNASATMIQSFFRGTQRRLRFLILLDSVSLVQRFYRGCKGRERWWKIRQAVAGELLTNTFRMLIVRRKFVRAKQGTIQFQASYRGYSARRLIAIMKIQTHIRMYRKRKSYFNLKSAAIALQCRLRRAMAIKLYTSLRREQKDIGKLKENNERLKLEMASLKAMLAAQAKEDASRQESDRELKEREKEIISLKKRIAQLEAELEKSSLQIQKLQAALLTKENQLQKEIDESKDFKRAPLQQEQDVLAQPTSPVPSRPTRKAPSSSRTLQDFNNIPYDNEVIAKLERVLEAEREARRAADSEIIKLRAEMNGVKLDASELDALLPSAKVDIQDIIKPPTVPDLDSTDIDDEYDSMCNGHKQVEANRPDHHSATSSAPTQSGSITAIVTNVECDGELSPPRLPPQAQSPSSNVNAEKFTTPKTKLNRNHFTKFMRSPNDFIPSVHRGEDVKADSNFIAVGWKFEAANRKEREEALRDEVHRFEVKMKKFYSVFEEGIDVTMWQYNRSVDFTEVEEFPVKGVPVQIQLRRHGDMLVQAVIAFKLKGSYISNALNRHKVDKFGLEPLSLHEILDVKAGCDGFDHKDLPVTGKAKPGEVKQSNLFLTLKALPTPVVSTRSYYLMFKSRSARNELLMGLRALLADLQIHEGVSVSQFPSLPDGNEVLIPLSEVHEALDFERRNYDRILLMMLQGSSDVKEKEDEVLMIREKMESMMVESKEKDRVQAEDSKLIMQLSKKLETLLMDNEDLREHNERLTVRLASML